MIKAPLADRKLNFNPLLTVTSIQIVVFIRTNLFIFFPPSTQLINSNLLLDFSRHEQSLQ